MSFDIATNDPITGVGQHPSEVGIVVQAKPCSGFGNGRRTNATSRISLKLHYVLENVRTPAWAARCRFWMMLGDLFKTLF